MAVRAVEVRECDRCGKEPAYTWVITGPEGAVREIDLCERHGAPVANAYALGRAVPRRATAAKRPRRAAREREEAPVPDGARTGARADATARRNGARPEGGAEPGTVAAKDAHRHGDSNGDSNGGDTVERAAMKPVAVPRGLADPFAVAPDNNHGKDPGRDLGKEQTSGGAPPEPVWR